MPPQARSGVVPALWVVTAAVAALAALAISALADQPAPITPAQGIAFVRAVNLQPADLPGSAPFQAEEGSAPDAFELQRSALHCGHLGKPRGRTVAAERSVLADRNGSSIGEIVGSLVIVMPSEGLAKAEIANLATRQGHTCLAHDLRVAAIGFAGPHAPVYSVRLASVPVADTLGPGAVDLRFTARLRKALPGGPSAPPKFSYTSEAIFRVGAADIAFLVESERRALPAATETHLLSVLHARAEAQAL